MVRWSDIVTYVCILPCFLVNTFQKVCCRVSLHSKWTIRWQCVSEQVRLFSTMTKYVHQSLAVSSRSRKIFTTDRSDIDSHSKRFITATVYTSAFPGAIPGTHRDKKLKTGAFLLNLDLPGTQGQNVGHPVPQMQKPHWSVWSGFELVRILRSDLYLV